MLFDTLHFRHDDTCFLALAIDVVYLGNEPFLRDGGVKDVFQINRQHVEEPFRTGGTDRVRRVIICRPSVGSISTCSVRKTVENTLVGEGF